MKQALLLSTLAAANLAAAFAFQWLVLLHVGAGVQADAFFAASTVPMLVISVGSVALSSALVPLLAGESTDTQRQIGWTFVYVATGVLVAVALVLSAFCDRWVPVFLPGFEPVGRSLTVSVTRIQLLTMAFAGINTVQWSLCHARREFKRPEVVALLANSLAALLLLVVLPRSGVVGASWILVFRAALQTILLAPAIGSPVVPDVRGSAAAEGWRRIRSLLLGSTYYKTDPLVDRYLLSHAAAGTLSTYHMAQQILGALSQVVGKAFASPLVPSLALRQKASDHVGFMQDYHRRVRICAGVAVAALFAIFWSHPLLAWAFDRPGRPASSDAIWLLLMLLGASFIGNVVGQVSSFAYYAAGRPDVPTRIGMLSFTLYVPLKVVAYQVFGIEGVAISTCVFVVFNFLVQHALLGQTVNR